MAPASAPDQAGCLSGGGAGAGSRLTAPDCLAGIGAVVHIAHDRCTYLREQPELAALQGVPLMHADPEGSDRKGVGAGMGAPQAETAAHPGAGAPQFPIVAGGYERAAVDRHLAGLAQLVAHEQRRCDQAEQALSGLRLAIPAGPGHRAEAGVGPEADVAEVLQDAVGAAARMLAEAGKRIQATIAAAEVKAADRLKVAAQQASALEQRAQQTLAEAEVERARIQAAATGAAEQFRLQADREARAVVAKAQEDAERAWQHAIRRRRLLEAEAEDLVTLRQRMVEQLGRLYAPLGLLIVDSGGERGSES